MHTLRSIAALALFLGPACEPTIEEIEPAPVDSDVVIVDTDVDPGCALALSPADSWVLPRTDVELEATGGTGEYTFAVLKNNSGGLISPQTGKYFTGGNTDVVDSVVVTDAGCPGEQATAAVHVVTPMLVEPLSARITPGTRVAFRLEGGSGDFGCTMSVSSSEGDVSGCVYQAGSSPGIDAIEISDRVTGQVLSSVFEVDPGAKLHMLGRRWAVAVDNELRLPITGGSGHIEARVIGGVGQIEGGAFISNRAGRARVRFTDRYAGMTLDREVDVLAPRVPDDMVPDGNGSLYSEILRLGDIDGDGYDDALVSHPDRSYNAFLGGAVMVLAGGSDRMSVVRTFGSDQYGGYMGRQSAVGDFNNDGRLDLAIGTYQMNGETAAAGRVQVYHGVDGGFFEEEPSSTFWGTYSGDRLGHGLAAGDFDGDGYDDLAMSAYTAEARYDRSNISYTQGGVFVHRGGEFGLEADADSELWGVMAVDGAWINRTNQGIGLELGTGDLNDDGIDDLLVSTWNRGLYTSGNHGVVFWYKGHEDGVEERPSRMWAVTDPADTNAYFGWDVSIGDIDGDGKDDLAVAGFRVDGDGVRDAGGVAIYRGPIDEGDELVAMGFTDADWRVTGDGVSDYFGSSIDLYDLDGDGKDELIIGAPNDELPGRTSSMGVVHIFEGNNIRKDWDRPYLATRDARIRIEGPIRYAYFAQSVAAVGDMDGDGDVDLLSLAGRDPGEGPLIGAAYTFEGRSSTRMRRVRLPQKLSGQYVGKRGSTAFLNPNHDGVADLWIGAPGAALRDGWLNMGSVYAYDTQDDGDVSTSPDARRSRHYLHGSWDQYGWQISDAGDFDNDGYNDVAVVSNNESKPSVFSSTWFDNPRECSNYRGGSGAVWIFRGHRSGYDTVPSFVQYGSIAYDRVYELSSGADINGDGYSDVVYSSSALANSYGGFEIAWGRAESDSGKTLDLCDGTVILASTPSTTFGSAVAALGDLDGDGCDEIAVGARADDNGPSNQGSVRVLWGWGAKGCPSAPEISTIYSGDRSSQFGYSIDGGEDITGDGVPDMVVGAPYYANGGDMFGAAWVISGADLLSIPRQPVGRKLAENLETRGVTLGATLDGVRIVGPTVDSRFGEVLNFVRSGDAVRLAVGAPHADLVAPNIGAVLVYDYNDGVPDVAAVLVGETQDPGSRFGSEVEGGSAGSTGILAIGADRTDGDGVHVGAVYPWLVRE